MRVDLDACPSVILFVFLIVRSHIQTHVQNKMDKMIVNAKETHYSLTYISSLDFIVNHTSWCLQNENRLLVITNGHLKMSKYCELHPNVLHLQYKMGYERVFSYQQKLSYLFLQDNRALRLIASSAEIKI